MNEVAAALRKAGRGAGLDDGSARDLARAGVRAIVDGQPGFRLTLDLLVDMKAARAALAAADLTLAGEEADDASPLLPYLLDTDEAPRHGPFEIDEDDWAEALALAHRTYVPATEASRLAGAGAGTRDDD